MENNPPKFHDIWFQDASVLRENKTNSYTRGYLWASEVYVTIKLFT